MCRLRRPPDKQTPFRNVTYFCLTPFRILRTCHRVGVGKCLLKQSAFPSHYLNVSGLELFLCDQRKTYFFKEILVTEKPCIYCSHLWYFRLLCVPCPRVGGSGVTSQKLSWQRKELEQWEGVYFPFCYQKVVQMSTQEREHPLGDLAFRIMKTHFIFVERKTFVHLDINSA